MTQDFKFPIAEATELLDALSNEMRIMIIDRLVHREWDVGSLAHDIGLSQSALSQHLKKLRDAGLVSTRREAQVIYYSCRSEPVLKMMAALTAIFQRP